MRILTVLFTIVLCVIMTTEAQVVIKEGHLNLHENSKVSVQGEVINYGNITNKGFLSLTGHWQNFSSYTSSAGTIALTGSDHQLFSHNSQIIGVLYIANPTTIKLGTGVRVAHKLVLMEGVVIPELGANLILAESAEVEGGAPNAYIHGKMYHTGSGSKFYPVGKNGQYAPLTLSQVTGENPVTGVEFYDQAVSPIKGKEIIVEEFYWSLNSISGKFDGSPITLEVLSGNPEWEEKDWVIAGSELLEESFQALDDATVQLQGNRVIFSGSNSVYSPYITLGSREALKEMFYMPNALSPSASHPEDRAVKIYSKTIKPGRFQWTIWDSWGQVVYTTNSFEEASAKGWEGSHKGKGEALPGVYKYLLQGTFINGQDFSKKGNIILYK